MIFQKPSSAIALEKDDKKAAVLAENQREDNVDTVVGPSVNVEGDFSSAGNIVVKGSVSGSVHTSRHLLVEEGAKILANVQAGSATVSGLVRGNVRVSDSLVLTSTAKILGDINAEVLQVDAGAILIGKVSMRADEDLVPEKDNKFSARTNIRRRREKNLTEEENFDNLEQN